MIFRLLQRIMDRTAICLYLGAIGLLILTSTETPSAVNLLGGFSAATTMGMLNIVGIIRWILAVLPPVAVSVLFISMELGTQSTFTMLRSKSVVRWTICRIGVAFIANIVYPLMVCGIALLFSPYSWMEILRIFATFTSHICMVSCLSIFLIARFRSQKPAFFAFIVIEGCSVVVGSVVPSISKYMIGFWGMAQHSIYLFNDRMVHFAITSCFTMAICLISVIFTILHFRRNNPAASPSNL